MTFRDIANNEGVFAQDVAARCKELGHMAVIWRIGAPPGSGARCETRSGVLAVCLEASVRSTSSSGQRVARRPVRSNVRKKGGSSLRLLVAGGDRPARISTPRPGPGAQSALRALARSGMKIGRIEEPLKYRPETRETAT